MVNPICHVVPARSHVVKRKDNVVPARNNVVKRGNNDAPAIYNVVNCRNNVVPPDYNVVKPGNNVVPPIYNVVKRGNNVVPARNNVVKPFYIIVKNRSDMAGRRKNVVFTLKPHVFWKSGQIGTVGGLGIQRQGAKAQREELADGRWQMGAGGGEKGLTANHAKDADLPSTVRCEIFVETQSPMIFQPRRGGSGGQTVPFPPVLVVVLVLVTGPGFEEEDEDENEDENEEDLSCGDVDAGGKDFAV